MIKKLTVSCLIVAVFAVAGAAQDPHDGIYKPDLTKTHYTHPPPQSETITITSDATSHHVEFDIVMGDGQTMKAGISYPLKGGPVEMHGFPPDPKIDHASVKIINKDKFILSYFDKDNKLTSTRVVTYKGNESEAKWYVDGKVLEDEVCEKQKS